MSALGNNEVVVGFAAEEAALSPYAPYEDTIKPETIADLVESFYHTLYPLCVSHQQNALLPC